MKLLGKKIKKPKIKPEGLFLLKLFKILKDKKFSDYIYWSTDGKSIIIPNKNKFIKNVLPKFCNTHKYSSFVRQLNMYDFSKIKTEDRDLQKYRHEEFTKFKSEDEVKLIKKKLKSEVKKEDKIQISNIFDKKLGEADIAEDKNFLEKIDKLDEESKLKEFENILKKGHLSNAFNEKILNYLLDKSKENIIFKNNIEEDLKKVIIENNNLMEQIEIFKNALTLQNQNIKKKNQLIATITLLYLNKIIDNKKNLGEKEINKQLKKRIFDKIKQYKKNQNLRISNMSNISNRNNSIIVNDINLLINHDIFNNKNFYNNDNNNEISNMSYFLNPFNYYDNKNINFKNSINTSNIFPDRFKINNSFRNNLNNFNTSNTNSNINYNFRHNA